MTTRTDYIDAEEVLLTDLPRIAAFGATASRGGRTNRLDPRAVGRHDGAGAGRTD